MGQIVKTDEQFEYQQENGEPTAWFPHIEEKIEIVHKGSPFYKKIFYILISMGFLYLIIVFTSVH
ncbi:MAG: hypothetical protein GY860_23630 [Desulfobacteraceae bacterium]|nr:hypothetical protein [Desulfobacteraceae bacterium]